MNFDNITNTALLIVFLLIGAAVFIIGMNMMSSGLKKAAGKGVKKIFKRTKDNRFACLGIGAGVTAIIQSSAATSVMAIGFINAGVMTVFQGVAIMMGSYIGTTVTGILASLATFPFTDYLMLLAVIGVALTFFKNDKIKAIGEVLCGLGLLFFGLKTMSAVFKHADISNACINIFTEVSKIPVAPILLMLLGIAFTALVQSSSATTGIVVALAASGAIEFKYSLYVIIGATIGTFISTLLAAVGSGTNAKRAAFVAFIIKVAAGLIGLAVVWPLESVISNGLSKLFGEAGLAAAMFNLIYVAITMAIFIPFIKPLQKIANKAIKDKDEEKNKKAIKYLNDKFLNSPDVAMVMVKKEIENMANLSFENLKKGYDEIVNQVGKYGKEIEDREESIDYINGVITKFLINLSQKVDLETEQVVGSYFHVINDIERIGDHANNFNDLSKKMVENELKFSDTAKEGLKEMYDLVEEMYKISFQIFENNSKELLITLHELEEKTDDLKRVLSDAHYERITKNTCTVELSPFYSNLVSELERIADHLVNIGYSIVNPTGDEK